MGACQTQHFTLEEIQGLCFDLTVEFEHLAGRTRPLKIQNLITHLAQRQRLPDLLYWLKQRRPLVDWTAVSQCAPGVIYCENFENGRADNWQLKSGWEVVEADANQHYLQGSENEFVILQHIGWEDYRLRFRFKLEKGKLSLMPAKMSISSTLTLPAFSRLS